MEHPSTEIRLLRKKDARKFFKMMEANRSRLKSYFPITSRNTKTLKSTEEYISKKVKDSKKNKFFGWVIIDKAENQMAGYIIMKNFDWRVPKCELAYMISQNYEGTGMMTNCINTISHFAFDDMGILKLFLLVSDKNPASLRVGEKAGFEVEGYLKSEYRDGKGKLNNVYHLSRFE